MGTGGDHALSIELPAEPRSVAAARHAAAGVAERLGCDVFAVKLAVSELVTNAATHAYTGIDAGPIVVLARSIRGRLVITVADRGRGMTIRPDSPGLGMGLPLVSSVAHDVRIESDDDGVAVSAAFDCSTAGARVADDSSAEAELRAELGRARDLVRSAGGRWMRVDPAF